MWGLTRPSTLANESNASRKRNERIFRKQYYRMCVKSVPLSRDIKVTWHVGESGSGKSYTYTHLCKEHGVDKVYLLTDYDNGGFDNYCAEPILFMDEFKGNMTFQILLNYLDRYPVQVHCRYANAYALWNEVHITSVFPPEEVYLSMVDPSMRDKDKKIQLLRRIHVIIYHYKENGEHKRFELPMEQYENYEQLKELAHNNGFAPITGKTPFDL